MILVSQMPTQTTHPPHPAARSFAMLARPNMPDRTYAFPVKQPRLQCPPTHSPSTIQKTTRPSTQKSNAAGDEFSARYFNTHFLGFF